MDSSTPALDLDAGDPIEEHDGYYYHHQGDIVPVDPDLGILSTSSSHGSGRRASFRSDLIERDTCCVVSDMGSRNCEAAHIIRYSLGDTYIEQMTTKRRYNHDPIIHNINDVRNGLLCNVLAHKYLGKTMAFLQVPNPFMELHHMPDYNQSLTGPRYYLQNFDASDRDDRDFALFAAHNRRARRPQNLGKWPTHTLFAFVYGVVAMHAFPPGPLSECVHILRWNWGSGFYSSAVGNNRDGELSSISAQRGALAERKREQDDARAARRANRTVQEVDEAAIVVAMIREIIDRDNEASTEELKRQAEQRRQEQAREKVADWLAGVQPHSR